MKKSSIVILCITIPLVAYGILVLVFGSILSQINTDSEHWMVELEPSLNLTPRQVLLQIQDIDSIQSDVLRVQSLEKYFESFSPEFTAQLKNSTDTNGKFIFYISKESKHTDDDIRNILTNIDGIKRVEKFYEWIKVTG